MLQAFISHFLFISLTQVQDLQCFIIVRYFWQFSFIMADTKAIFVKLRYVLSQYYSSNLKVFRSYFIIHFLIKLIVLTFVFTAYLLLCLYFYQLLIFDYFLNIYTRRRFEHLSLLPSQLFVFSSFQTSVPSLLLLPRLDQILV